MINQLRASRVVLLNKTDRVKTHMLKLLVESVKEINPDADVYATSFGRLDQAVVKEVLGGPSISPLPEEHRERAQDEHEHEHEHEGEHEHEDEDSFARQFETFSKKYDKIFDPQRLEIFFERLRDQDYGDVVRAKGIFRTPLKWIKLELASREVRIDPVPATDVSVVSIIGRAINTKEIESDLIGCQR
jgi:G3E family GTPase